MIVEFVAGERGLHAVPYRCGKPHRPIKIAGGTYGKVPTREQMRDAPRGYPAHFEVTRDGAAVETWPDGSPKRQVDDTMFLGLHGVFVLPNGFVGAIYGGTARSVTGVPVPRFGEGSPVAIG